MAKKFIVVFVFLFSYVFASFEIDFFGTKEIDILKSLDIEPSFATNRYYISLQKELRKYKYRHFFNSYSKNYIYIPTIKRLIGEAGIPQVFLYMVMAESNFSIKAKSRKRAIGLWQFIKPTAIKYGLKIDGYVDERKDPIKSTIAAIKYLKHLYSRFGKWYLAALAYNCGEGKVFRAIKKAKTDKLSILIDPKRKYLPRESRRYIRKILAIAKMIGDERYMIKRDFDYMLNRGSAYSIAIIKVPGGELLGNIAKSIKIKESHLRELNAHLKYGFTPPDTKEYEVYIPYIKLANFYENYSPKSLKNIFISYKVKRGDSLAKIASIYGISYKAIKDFNNLRSNFLRINQRLIIPIPRKNRVIYRVKKGDTLLKIARKYGISVKKIKKINRKKRNMIKIGEELVVIN